jgi:hypothetical protein
MLRAIGRAARALSKAASPRDWAATNSALLLDAELDATALQIERPTISRPRCNTAALPPRPGDDRPASLGPGVG